MNEHHLPSGMDSPRVAGYRGAPARQFPSYTRAHRTFSSTGAMNLRWSACTSHRCSWSATSLGFEVLRSSRPAGSTLNAEPVFADSLGRELFPRWSDVRVDFLYILARGTERADSPHSSRGRDYACTRSKRHDFAVRHTRRANPDSLNCLETTYGSRARYWPLGTHLPPPNRRFRSAKGFALRPSRGSAAGASGPSWRSIWTLPWRRAPTHAGTSLVKDGLLEPRLPLGHAHQCMCEA